MSFLILPSRKSVLSLGDYELNSGNPINRGVLSLVADRGSVKQDLVSRLQVPRVNPLDARTTGALEYAGTEYRGAWDSAPINVSGLTEATLFTVAIKTPGPTTAFGGPSAVTQVGETNRALSMEPGIFFSAWSSTGTRFNINASGFTLTPLGVVQTLALTVKNSTMNAYINGRLVGSGSGPATLMTFHNLFSGSNGGGFWGCIVPINGAWGRALSGLEIRSISDDPSQLVQARTQRPFFFDMGAGGGAGNATGTLAAITLTAATGTGSGAASASSALAAISLTAPQATASGGAVGLASGALPAVTLSAPTASAQGSASASGELDGIDLSPPTANATAGATGFASGAVAPITLAAATGTASGSAIASAAYAGITLIAPNGTASAGQVGLASGALAPISINAPQGSATGAAAAFAAYTGITLTPPQGTADATSPVGNAAGSLRAITLTAITATANGGVVFARAPSGSGYPVKAQTISRPDRLQSSGRPATTNTRRP